MYYFVSNILLRYYLNESYFIESAGDHGCGVLS